MKPQRHLLLTNVARPCFLLRMEPVSVKLEITSLSADGQWSLRVRGTGFNGEKQLLDEKEFAGSKPLTFSCSVWGRRRAIAPSVFLSNCVSALA